ncbi:MAG: TM0996/MTH895 family glutaredoxin-like protein [Firmicutes bacterium]|nr:TM0996/MTH895 family glutaredoxin-like protein [Candidatus Fermentithermobacillaceae bacterium]
MKIEIMGPGCPRCQKTESLVADVVRKLGIKADIVKITDLKQIADRGVMATPAVFVNGVKKIEGKIPSESMIQRWLEEAKQQQE